MTHRIGSQVNFSSSPQTNTSSFINHQKWQIELECDPKSNAPIFQIKDLHGRTFIITEFVIEDAAPYLKEVIACLNIAEQQRAIYQYLQERLDLASSHQIHIDDHEHGKVIRFGDYGLKGGSKRKAGVTVSIASVGTGIVMSAKGNVLKGGVLISAGLSGGLYAYQETEERFSPKEYGKQILSGALSSLASGSISQHLQATGFLLKIGAQALASAGGSAVSTLTSDAFRGSINPSELLKKVLIGGFSGIMSSATSAAIGYLPSLIGSSTNEALAKISDDATDVALHVLKKASEGAAEGALGQVVTNALEEESLGTNVAQASLLGGLIKGSLAGAEQVAKIREWKNLSHQKEQAETDLKKAQAETKKMEQAHQDHRAAEKDALQKMEIELKRARGRVKFWKQKIQINRQQLLDREAFREANSDHEKHLLESQLEKLKVQELALLSELQKTDTAAARIQEYYSKLLSGSLPKQPISTAGLGQRARALEAALQPEPVTFVETDCSMQELIQHVVLIHALNHAAPPMHLALEMTQFASEKDLIITYLKGMITSDGTLGTHLQLEKRELQEKLEDRPQIHWSWNQFVQPNSGGSWENARIAILEPLSTFEDTLYHQPFSVAPYDTMIFGQHRLSDKSSLLIPADIGNEVQSYLAPFSGRIILYNPGEKTLRAAVFETLQNHYPETWHICDEKGKLTGDTKQYSSTGYNPLSCIKNTNGQVIPLLKNAGSKPEDLISRSMKEYNKTQRFIGLHIHSVTFWLESEKQPYFIALKKFSNNRTIVKNNPLFAGSVHSFRELSSLGILKAFEFYQTLTKFNPKTGAKTVADYILKNALYADFVSLFYQAMPDEVFRLSALDLTIVFGSIQIALITTLLDDIQRHQKSNDADQKVKAFELFELYCSLLKECLKDIQQAKEQALQIVHVEQEELDAYQHDSIATPLCLTIAQDEWQEVELPENIEFNLDQCWPLNDRLHVYVYKILHALPIDPNDLKQLYLYLSCKKASRGQERKEEYRLNIILNIIQWIFQEKIYLASRTDETSVLANKLSRFSGWLSQYGLEADDFTQKLGDCLFDNVARQLSITTSSGSLRQDVVAFMREHSDEYSSKLTYTENTLLLAEGGSQVTFSNWDQYLECMDIPQVWATELEITALAKMLNCPIVLIENKNKPKIYNPEAENHPIFLHYLNTNHFEACIPFKGLTAKDIYNKIKLEDHQRFPLANFSL